MIHDTQGINSTNEMTFCFQENMLDIVARRGAEKNEDSEEVEEEQDEEEKEEAARNLKE